MTTILGLSGSLRRASFNSGLLRAAAELAPEGTTILPGSIREVPLYDADLEAADGLPQAVQKLQEQLRDADGLLLVTPEYNNGVPGVFKNAIDWMSRGDGLDHFKDKPVAVIGASPGGFGTILSQDHWLPVLRTLRMRPWFQGRLMVSRAGTLFDDQGNLTDAATREHLAEFVAGFAAALQRG
ncbi:NAD(P)H-dependent FMN reductase [Paracoccus halophilus]|uniref:NAD(P)H-dependent FMN reductase n=1 Tax=Paracoccus halophilus TaxID=376733 RepID=A0A099F280_9RHOB|nr:NADPH-dependent FMN reductase [Paracoccus halophilus]KGJ04351.1 NADPH-dependent FMN reductase [Paracoccus halophilus]SFA55188.1 NAD(P)H-dependent FMN reductase [Paracoccus halophilus]